MAILLRAGTSGDVLHRQLDVDAAAVRLRSDFESRVAKHLEHRGVVRHRGRDQATNAVLARCRGQSFEQGGAQAFAVQLFGDRKGHLGGRWHSGNAKVGADGDDPDIAVQPPHRDQRQAVVGFRPSVGEVFDDRVGGVPSCMKALPARLGRELVEEAAHRLAIGDGGRSHRRDRSVPQQDEPVIVFGRQGRNGPHVRPLPQSPPRSHERSIPGTARCARRARRRCRATAATRRCGHVCR